MDLTTFTEQPLFAGASLIEHLQAQRHEGATVIRRLRFDAWPTVSKVEYIASTVAKYTLRVPVLDRSGITVTYEAYTGHAGKMTDINMRGHTDTVPAVRYLFRIPFTGDSRIFGHRPSHYSNQNHATAVVDNAIFLCLDQHLIPTQDSAAEGWATTRLNEFLSYLDETLSRIRGEVQDSNASLAAHFSAAFDQRAAERQVYEREIARLSYPQPMPKPAPMPPLKVRRTWWERNVGSVMPAGVLGIIAGLMAFGVIVSVAAKEEDDTVLMMLQCVAISIELPIVVSALFILVRNVASRYDDHELEYGVVSGEKAATEIDKDIRLEPIANADEIGRFTLLFRNREDEALRNITFRISGRRADDGAEFLLTAPDAVHVTSETNYQTLKTTDKFDSFSPGVIMTLALRAKQHGILDDPVTVNIRLEVIKSDLRRPPGPYVVQVTFGGPRRALDVI